MDESGTDEAECSRKVASGRRVAGAIKSLVNVRSLQIECARGLASVIAGACYVLEFKYLGYVLDESMRQNVIGKW